MSVCVLHPNFGCLIQHCALFHQNASRVYASGLGLWEVSLASSGTLWIMTAEEKDRKSISGNSFMMSGGAVSWSAKKQGLVALSTLEAEYISICHAMQHILWYQMMIQELRFGVKHPFNLNNDNHCTTALTHNPQFHAQSKHIDIHHHFIQELIKHGNIKVTHIQSLDNLADVFTKPLPEVLFKKFASTTIVMTGSPRDGKALKGQQTWAQPLGWPLSHWVCWVVSEMVQGYHSQYSS